MTAVIFDLDGTLVDSVADIGAAVDRVLRARNLRTHSIASYAAMLGHGARELLARAVPDAAGATLDHLVAEFRADYRANLVVRTDLYPGIAELLDALSERTIAMAVLSNKPHEFTVSIAERLLARWRFAAILGQRDHVPRKPDPAGALELACSLGVAPSDIVFVGDSQVDVQTAKAAAMRPVAVTWGYGRVAVDVGVEAIASPEQLLPILGP
jgi:phosphoglycolate phosphatase